VSKLDLSGLVICLEELADRAFQERAWLGHTMTEMSSFAEQVSQTFDDTGLSAVIARPDLDAIVGADAASALRGLNTAVDRVDQSLPPAELIDHPDMQSVREHARRALWELRRTR
jgi:hypothetical protein